MEKELINNKNLLKFLRLNEVVLSIGSNTSDRKLKVEKATKEIKEIFGDVRFSSSYPSPSYSGVGGEYINTVAIIENSLNLKLPELENKLKSLEIKAGRVLENKNCIDVPLDIDIVIFQKKILRKNDYDRYYFFKGFQELIDPRSIRIDKYIYELPKAQIALHPIDQRDHCKLLVCTGEGNIEDSIFYNIGNYLSKDNLIIYNDTKVINARLKFTKETGAQIQIFCLQPNVPSDYQLNFSSTGPVSWKCLVGNSKKWKDSTLRKVIYIDGRDVNLYAKRLSQTEGDSIIEFKWDDSSISFAQIISAAGEIPIPPYLERESEKSDIYDYQTVFSRIEGSVAAPTAGLHFSEDLLSELKMSGIKFGSVTLHVGAGTFKPVKSVTINGHEMHAELIDIKRDLILNLKSNKFPITAVGTTTVRTLESLYHIGCKIWEGNWNGFLEQWYPYSANHPNITVEDSLKAILSFMEDKQIDRLVAQTSIIIAPSYKFRIVNNLVTNFHQPGSTLLLLISAIVGESWRTIYEHAVKEKYRFLSYGDACLFLNI